MNKDKRLKLFALIGAAALLYTYTSYTIFFKDDKKNSSESTELANSGNASSLTLAELQEKVQKAIERHEKIAAYEATSGDPFGGYQLLKLTRPKERDANAALKAPVQTQLRLLGVIWDDTKPYALVTHANGKTYDVTRGAVVEGENIIRITKDHIIIEKEHVQFEITTSGFKKLGE